MISDIMIESCSSMYTYLGRCLSSLALMYTSTASASQRTLASKDYHFLLKLDRDPGLRWQAKTCGSDASKSQADAAIFGF